MGTDVLARDLKESFGPIPVQRAFDGIAADVEAARRNRMLSVAPAAGLIVHTPTALAMPVPRNTFFGAE